MNGKVRDRLILPVTVDEDHVRQTVLSRPKIIDLLDGRQPRKVIYIPGKIFSIVL